VPKSCGSADIEVLIFASEIVSLGQHVVMLDVKELGQAEITVHDVADVRVWPSYFFLI
jgi:hypothetical protein